MYVLYLLSFARLYYCKLLGLNREVTEQDVENIKQKMYRTIEQDIPFLMKSVPSDEAINYFEKKKAYDVSKLLQSLGQFYTKIYDFTTEGGLISSFSNSISYTNLKNDFHIWGENNNKNPIHYHIAIKKEIKASVTESPPR